MKQKIRVVTFNKYYLPGFKAGGPIRTISNMVDHLSDEFEFYIITLDRDAGDNNAYKHISRNKWYSVGSAKVMYLSSSSINSNDLANIVLEAVPDVIYLNSFFDSTFTQRILWARKSGKLVNIPIILAPRGEFSTGALNIKRIKKQFFIKLTSFIGLYKNLSWQVSSTLERKDLERNLSYVEASNIYEALNLTPKNTTYISPVIEDNKSRSLRICFLSRISPKKNLDFALNILLKIDSDVIFTIYGPRSDSEYWRTCECIIAKMPENINIVYKDEITPDEVVTNLSQHDLFFLPTHGENYGHVIHEALVSGLPVLISDQTPWNDLEDCGVGWAYSLSEPQLFINRIKKFANLSSFEVSKMKEDAIRYARSKSENECTIKNNKLMFYTAAAKKS